MKRSLRIFLTCSLLLSAGYSFSQPYWNEWINYSQSYYKIPVAQTGIYRLNSATLAGAGINVSALDPRNVQMFYRGQEQHIYIQGEADGSFDPGDYIEFYGQKNDGSLDTILYKGDLYKNSVHQPNPYYSLFNDTSAYFLTINSSTANKRIVLVPDTLYSGYAQTNFFMREDVEEYHTEYYYGLSTSFNINFPEYHETEGWAGPNFYAGDPPPQNPFSINFNTSNRYTGAAPAANLKLAVMGASNDQNIDDHHIQLEYRDNSGNFTLFEDTVFDGYFLFDTAYTFPASVFGSSTDIHVTALTGNFATSRNAVPYVTLKFPHTPNLENNNYYEFFVPENGAQNKSNYTFTAFDDMGAPAYVYDLTDHTRIPVTKSGGSWKALIANNIAATEKFCVIKSENQVLSVSSMLPVHGTGFFTNYVSLGADSAYIILTHKSLMTGATAYKNYRAGVQGGSFNTLLVDVEELYDQFGYGIPKYPLSIKHFAEFCVDTFPSEPQNLFIIGKSIQTNLGRNAYSDPNGSNYAASLVPSIGYPTCDIMLVSGLNGDLLRPGIPIGRLAATNNNDVSRYLQKVNEYEHPLPDPDEWMKQAIHLAGGNSASLTNTILQCLNGYKATLEDTAFGGHVHTFAKNSSSPTQISFADSIKDLINNGVSMITFFGHSSASVFDFNLLPPDQYQNTNGKYPFFCADGCIAGDIHQPIQNGISSSETYVLSNQGMIGFLASTGPGTVSHLCSFTDRFYHEVSHLLYGQSVGKIIQATIDNVEGNGLDPYMNATCLEMTLHGDPAIIIHSQKLPDYAVSASSVYFTPSYVSTDLDSFKASVVITNIGRATYDSVKVNITRTFVDGTSVSYADTVPYIFFKDTVTFTLPVDPLHGPGLNKFEVHVDPMNDVPELDDIVNNNISAPNEVPLLIYSGDIIPVYPYRYAIVPNDTIMLKAYTANPFLPSARYIFEVDTTDLFNSPTEKRTQYVTQMGAVVKAPFNLWSPSPLVLKDSMVYFWRVRRDTADTANFHWRESSFQYLAGKRGWGQSHFFQFLKGDQYNYVNAVRPIRYFDMEGQNHDIQVKASNPAQGGNPFDIYFYYDGGNAYSGSWLAPTTPHVIISVLDPATGAYLQNDGTGNNGSEPHVSGYGSEGFEFQTATLAQQDNLRKFLQDSIALGSKVILFTSGNHNLGDLIGSTGPTNAALAAAFQSVGATQFTTLKNDFPYALSGRKGGAATEVIADSLSQTIFLNDTFSSKRASGNIYSEVIGPAAKWKSLHWNFHSPEAGTDTALAAKDTILINVVGITMTGSADTLYQGITKDSLDILTLDQVINAATYPYLQLQAYLSDYPKRTPAQLHYWRVYYDGVPDASLNPFKYYSFYNSAVQQGDSIKLKVAIENIGDYDMDSLWVDFWIYDANHNKVKLTSMKMDPLLIDSVVVPGVKFSTEDLPGGLNSVWVEANPFTAQPHQLEQYHFNNIGTIPFTVGVDAINPLLDVTFDGVHIMNGDIVSSKPSILIKLKDENTFLALNDTSDFEIFLKRPSQAVFERVYFGNKMTFDAAMLPNNSCKITYLPILTDGTYEIKVQAKDRSGNNSGSVEYRISFEVINKPTITNVLNYPNPFSTSTRFVFTLTGSEVPDYFKIQILTISGKIVREVNKNELGPIHIGRNITEYAWDGKDAFGDQLANGLYLYRVLTQLDGKSLEHRDSGADPFFTQGYGKMYLIR